MNLESQLTEVLRRHDPPAGFAARVMSGVERRGPRWRFHALAAAALVAITITGWGVHATLHARNELLTAMRIASQKVAHAQQEIRK